jgi:hypothetical protein
MQGRQKPDKIRVFVTIDNQRVEMQKLFLSEIDAKQYVESNYANAKQVEYIHL